MKKKSELERRSKVLLALLLESKSDVERGKKKGKRQEDSSSLSAFAHQDKTLKKHRKSVRLAQWAAVVGGSSRRKSWEVEVENEELS